MIDIIKWLLEIESSANKMYSKAAKIYGNDPTYKTFFENAAEDEASHYNLLKNAAKIQAHIKKIEHFIGSIEKRPEVLKKITELPPVWVENILIVDDDEMIKHLIKALLNRSGNIDLADNGKEALKLIEKKFYKLIISDVDMPIMDGLSFFREAVIKFPKLKNRFLFITGYVSVQKESFFNENNLKYLTKPMKINMLREEASKIILS